MNAERYSQLADAKETKATNQWQVFGSQPLKDSKRVGGMCNKILEADQSHSISTYLSTCPQLMSL